jgi:hypothetical protein
MEMTSWMLNYGKDFFQNMAERRKSRVCDGVEIRYMVI